MKAIGKNKEIVVYYIKQTTLKNMDDDDDTHTWKCSRPGYKRYIDA